MSDITTLFENFVQERIYLKNISPRTIIFHNQAMRSFKTHMPEIERVDQLTKGVLLGYTKKLRDLGVKIVSINTYMRSLNAFLRWLLEEGHLTKRVKIPPLPDEEELVKTLPPQNLKALLSFKPQNFVERRIHLLTLLILDTGVRIQEAIFLGVPEIDLDNLIFKIRGKGRKERIVPFSFELRKHIVKYLNLKFFSDLPKNRTLFCNLEGGVVLYNNLRRDYLNMLSKIGVPHQGAFHRLRHTFATNYVKGGGNVLYLQKVLGHTELSTTQIYVEADLEALKEVQMRTSLLSRGGGPRY